MDERVQVLLPYHQRTSKYALNLISGFTTQSLITNFSIIVNFCSDIYKNLKKIQVLASSI